jgi:5-methyltetrahydropteroyltriglutamate--homocysteine methyltransferase
MKTSSDRILTTHVGSLPRPKRMFDLLMAKEAGGVDAAAFDAESKDAVAETVAQQVGAGIDIVSDGEMSKLAYTLYVRHRLTGIEMSEAAAVKGRHIMMGRDRMEHPDFADRIANFSATPFPGCIGPVRYADRGLLDRDLAHLKDAVAKAKPVEAFMTAPSPGILTRFVPDLYYNDEDAYVDALAKAMRTEYQAIVGAGFLLQIDCPDLASARNNQYRDLTDEQFLRTCERNIAALNAATEGLPADRMRLHICWGNYEGPHTHDIPIIKIIDICLKGRPQAFSFEGANPRHEHEWEDLKAVKFPADTVLIPGIIDSTTNFVEHPRLVAQRIGRYAAVVGKERVIAGADCGFATSASASPMVAPSIVWAKFKALAEGARMASEQLWPRAR